jgi:hypothetical protein
MVDVIEGEVLDPEAGAEGAAEGQTNTEQPNDAADKAQLQGWTDKDAWEAAGKDPDKWVDAETFLKRGESMAPVLKRELDKANRQISKLEETVKRLDAYSSKAEQRAYQRAKADFEAQLEAAAEAGDVEGVKAATRGMIDLEKEAQPDPKGGPTEDFQEAFADWHKENPWFRTEGSDKGDTVMTSAAVTLYGEQPQSLPEPEKLKRVGEAIRKRFPQEFENPRRREAAAVEGGNTARRTSGKSYSDLPADGKAECDFFVKNVKGFTRERYVKDYFGAQ